MAARVLLLSCLLVNFAWAQFDTSASRTTLPVQVHVVISNGEACDPTIRVVLVSVSGALDEGSMNEKCVAEFQNVAAGTYRVTVSGHDIPPVETSAVLDTASAHDLEVRVTRDNSAPTGGSAFVNAADLRIPPNARKEYDKANQLIAKQEWAKAAERLTKVIAIYPEYAAAYNALGVAYSHLGDKARERESLMSAIRINDHFAPAHLNLGRLYILSGNFRDAEPELSRASDLNPADIQTLVLLTLAEFENHHFAEAIATARRTHATKEKQTPHASVHLIAARAWELQKKPAEAGSELRLFLSEDANGPKSEAARKQLALLSSGAR
jgi:Flp pilus assembly protein TadD